MNFPLRGIFVYVGSNSKGQFFQQLVMIFVLGVKDTLKGCILPKVIWKSRENTRKELKNCSPGLQMKANYPSLS